MVGTINIPLRKKFIGKNEKVYPDFEEGKEAITNFKVLKNFIDYSLVELKPITGRTHQLRVHMAYLGHAILGDEKYGKKNSFSRLALHAQSLGFFHPGTTKYMEFSVVPPSEIVSFR